MKEISTIARELEALPKRTPAPGERGVDLAEIERYIDGKLRDRDRALRIIKDEMLRMVDLIGRFDD